MMTSVRLLAVSALCLSGALAHVTVQPSTVDPEGGYFKIALRVPHGCGVGEGDDRVFYPTHKIETTVPAEVMAESSARGEWIPFWPATVEDNDDGTRTISWTAEDDLDISAEQFKEFGITLKVPPMGDMESLGFPTIQHCIDGDGEAITSDWTEDVTPTLTYYAEEPCPCGATGYGSR